MDSNINKKIIVPPIKCQGIKTKLVTFIKENINWDFKGRWIEPFLGSGVVAFNINPERALLSDSNKHIINFYTRIQNNEINSLIVRRTLELMGNELTKNGADYYYQIRDEFNRDGDSLKFLFLNRSCFNGLMRFNTKGFFNVPYGHKPKRFSKSYITKISNQVKNIEILLFGKDWVFKTLDWKNAFKEAQNDDFVYLDPPYIGRHTDYYNSWTDNDAVELSEWSSQLECKYALSMWLANKYRKNDHIKEFWKETNISTFNHFYHVGSTENLRSPMVEALVTKY